MAENTVRLPKYGRASKPPSMRLTARDKHILEALHAYDGMLGFSQIRRLFFTGESQAEERLKLLYQNGYLNRPNRDQRRRLPEIIYWLDRRTQLTNWSISDSMKEPPEELNVAWTPPFYSQEVWPLTPGGMAG